MLDKTGEKQPHKWLVTALILAGVLMATLDGTIVNVALPTLAKDFRVELASLQWVFTAYLLTIATLIMTFGRLGDMLGKSRIHNFGFLWFTIGSALCGLAQNNSQLILFRVVQAVGAAMFMANNIGIITAVFPRTERGKALGLIAAAVATGSLTGPALGGVLVQHAGWPTIFYINVPIGMAGFLAGLFILPKEQGLRKQKFDIPGALLFTAAMLLFLFGLTQGEKLGWTSAPIIGSLVLACGLGAFFVWLEKRVPEPMIDLSLFGSRLFSAGVGAALLYFIAVFIILIHIPFYLEKVLRLEPGQVGLVMMAQPLAMAVVAPFSGWLSDRIGYIYLTTGGMALTVTAFMAMTSLDDQTPVAKVIVLLAMVGTGGALFQSPNSSSIMSTVPPPKYGVAGGITATARNTGMVIGTALGVALLTIKQQNFLTGIVNPTSFQSAKAFLTGLKSNFLLAAAVAAAGVVVSLVRGKEANRAGEGLEKVHSYLRQKSYYKWLVLALFSLSIFRANLEIGIINVSLPTIAKEFGAEVIDLQWVVTAYILAVAGLSIVFGRLGDIFGKFRIYLLGYIIFLIGSALGGASETLFQLIGARVVQGVGVAMLISCGVGLLGTIFSRQERGRAMGLQAAANGAGSILGPALGGLLIYYISWRSIFFINLPVGFLGLVASIFLFPREKVREKTGFDIPGAVFFFLATSLLLFGLSQGPKLGWSSIPVIVTLAGSVVATACFILAEKKATRPLLDLSLFKNRLFSAGMAAITLSFVAKMIIGIHIPFYLQTVRHLNPVTVGLVSAAIPLAILVVSPLSGWLSDRIGPVYLTTGGLALNTAGLISMLTLTDESSITGIFLRLVVLGLGSGLFNSPNNASIVNAVPTGFFGMVGGTIATGRLLGQALGASLGAAALTFGQGLNLYGIINPTSSQVAKAFMVAIKANFALAAVINILAIIASLIRGNAYINQGKGRGRRGPQGQQGSPGSRDNTDGE